MFKVPELLLQALSLFIILLRRKRSLVFNHRLNINRLETSTGLRNSNVYVMFPKMNLQITRDENMETGKIGQENTENPNRNEAAVPKLFANLFIFYPVHIVLQHMTII